MRPTPSHLTVRETANLLGYRSLRSVHRLIRAGELKATRHSPTGIRPHHYISKRSINAMLRRRHSA